VVVLSLARWVISAQGKCCRRPVPSPNDCKPAAPTPTSQCVTTNTTRALTDHVARLDRPCPAHRSMLMANLCCLSLTHSSPLRLMPPRSSLTLTRLSRPPRPRRRHRCATTPTEQSQIFDSQLRHRVQPCTAKNAPTTTMPPPAAPHLQRSRE
jgi:hypothetical protein